MAEPVISGWLCAPGSHIVEGAVIPFVVRARVIAGEWCPDPSSGGGVAACPEHREAFLARGVPDYVQRRRVA